MIKFSGKNCIKKIDSKPFEKYSGITSTPIFKFQQCSENIKNFDLNSDFREESCQSESSPPDFLNLQALKYREKKLG